MHLIPKNRQKEERDQNRFKWAIERQKFKQMNTRIQKEFDAQSIVGQQKVTRYSDP
jgi:hypothetical protein